MAPEMLQALDQRRELIEQRATDLVARSIHGREPRIKQLGEAPTHGRDRWTEDVRTVAAYRDRYGITSRTPLGAAPITDAQRIDRARAVVALRQVAQRADSQRHPRGAHNRPGMSL
ncbi:hypothetical protein [Nocardioides sp. B-3]|uniref:hypothetical protein n=1 Tax=Nocardioides sp. B-3 TaxID=2895565 RepID=UPI0021536F2F|nr:hypothetical protein [Nocardioides sp. B-3]UUZ58218.1 hypothetical protein LP418_18445 [Nocardioides sp. B-3]